ncbi:hypothetical protein J2Z65_003232 [Paenibacillus aceris]|uniref:Uncharacterized protein n=1 Tax=Paenibacillus aceris TaxID=869555 RepID=A0ABS4I0Q7_9BACL|nr:hypothetical protein [Paenibacillus aceris]
MIKMVLDPIAHFEHEDINQLISYLVTRLLAEIEAP